GGPRRDRFRDRARRSARRAPAAARTAARRRRRALLLRPQLRRDRERVLDPHRHRRRDAVAGARQAPRGPRGAAARARGAPPVNERDQDTLGQALARAVDTPRVRETPFAASRLASRMAPAAKRGFTFQLALAVALIPLGAAGALLGQTDLTRDLSVASGPRLGPVTRAAPGAPVGVGHSEDAINPITARYVERVIADAQSAGAPAVVFVINTPGGLIDSTYRITTDFLNAPLPVVTYVAPSGPRAASAGTFITMAGAIAAMAPATNIGAAHPVDSSGADIQGDLRLKAE